jgi:uncharacterized phage protein (TIGR02218 family)
VTYLSVERSQAGGEPKELYRFVQGATVWTYTSGDAIVNYNSENYAPTAIHRTGMVVSDEGSSAQIDVEVPRDLAVVAQFISGAVPAPLWLTIYRKHASDAEVVTSWVGQIREAHYDEGSCMLSGVPLKEALYRVIPRWTTQLTCNNALYDTNCQVVAATYQSTGTISTIVGNVITASLSPSQSAPYFKAGILQFGVYKSMIIDHVGSNITLLTLPPGLIVGSSVTVMAGCDRQAATCRTKFSNAVNFRGWPAIPIKNPFEGMT